MSNFSGLPFRDFVRKQINVRQKSLGKYTKIPSQDLQHYTTKTPFLRLVSSVNLTKGKNIKNPVLDKVAMLTGIPESELIGKNLAQRFMLQGGVADDKDGKGLKEGLNDGKSLFDGAYGWGGPTERGYVPMPGILNADVTYYNDGAFAKTIINCKVYNYTQFALFDVLYMRPGYTCLMEFGWTQYLDNNGELKTQDNFKTPALKAVLGGGKTQFEVYEAIQKHRTETNGNYDGVFGKVSKFNWTLNTDGSYNCTIVLTAMGDLIQALKVNIASPNLKSVKTSDVGLAMEVAAGAVGPLPPLIANANKTVLNRELLDIYLNKSDTGTSGWGEYVVKNYIGVENSTGKSLPPTDLSIPNSIYSLTGTTTDAENPVGQSPQVFIKYGAFLAFVQSRLLLFNSKDNSPIFSFDMNFKNLDKDENVILKMPGMFSSDPRVCLIPWENSIVPEGGLTMPESSINKILSESAWSYSQYLGRLSQICININFIASCLETVPEENGKINLLALLKAINKGIIKALGGVNSFDIKLDDENPSLIKFIEDIPQRRDDGTSKEEGTYTRFNIFGVKPDVDGSFVRDINLTAEISDNFASMIAIGAQASSNQISENALSFSQYNSGLIDRVIEEKLNQGPKESIIEEEEQIPKTIKTNWETNINPPENSLFVQTYGALQWTAETLDPLTSHNSTHCSLILGELTSEKFSGGQQLQSPQFLPFNLSLEMDGLSGMRLREKFLVTEAVLPPSYQEDSIDMQIQGINHSINPTAWLTKIETISVPAEKLAPIKRPPSLSSEVTYQTGAGGGSGGAGNSNDPTLLQDPPPPLDPSSINRRNAMQSSYNGVFGRDGQKAGMCAQWAWNLAKNYVEYLRGRGLSNPKQNAGGNANQNGYHKRLVSAGYTQTKAGTNISKAKLKNLLITTTWGYGDVVVYYGTDGTGNHKKYGHTQIYVGDINSYKWASSYRDNYKTYFPYNTTGNSTKWDYYVFRAPAT